MNIVQRCLQDQYKRILEEFYFGRHSAKDIRKKLIEHHCDAVAFHSGHVVITAMGKRFIYRRDFKEYTLMGVR